MMLTYYSHCAFLWATPEGVRVLVDPYGNSSDAYWFLKRFPSVQADVVLITHDHFDHNAFEELPNTPTLLRGPGEFRLRDVFVKGVQDIHAGRSGILGMLNTMFLVEIAGVRYCHTGDNRPDFPDEIREKLGDVDVLMITVDDSCHLLSYEQVDGVIERFQPKVVIPTHYSIEGLTTQRITTTGSPLEPPTKWLKTQSLVRDIGKSSLEIRPDSLPKEREVWVFDSKRI